MKITGVAGRIRTWKWLWAAHMKRWYWAGGLMGLSLLVIIASLV